MRNIRRLLIRWSYCHPVLDVNLVATLVSAEYNRLLDILSGKLGIQVELDFWF